MRVNDAAIFEANDAISDIENASVVRDHKHRAAGFSGQFYQKIDNITPALAVERGCWFVG